MGKCFGNVLFCCAIWRRNVPVQEGMRHVRACFTGAFDVLNGVFCGAAMNYVMSGAA